MNNSELKGFSMLGLFLMEAENQAQVLSTGLLKLEKDPANTSGLEALMRAAHSLKGGARIVQSDLIVRFAHSMEDYFVAVIKGKINISGEHIDQLLCGVDLIKSISETPESAFYEKVESIKNKIAELSTMYKDFTENIGTVTAAAHSDIPVQETCPVPPLPSPRTAEKYRTEPVVSSAKPLSGKEKFIKVAAPRMERLMGLAGESFVNVKKIHGMENQIGDVKKTFGQLAEIIGRYHELSTSFEHRSEAEEVIFNELSERCGDISLLLSAMTTDFSDFALKMETFSDDLYHEVISCKIMPFGDLSKVFPRMMRDVSKKLGKQVNFEISGEKTGLDRDILEMLEAPIDHLLRNALDHGLETPEERIALGKPPTGTVKLTAFHWAGMFNVTITDDGRGIDLENLKQHISSKELATPETLKNMATSELLDFLFLPGFSTKNTVSEISGRGVGLDVVMSMVQDVKGSIEIETGVGKYTTFHLRLPISRSVISALIVEIGGELYAFPSTKIDHLMTIIPETIQMLENHQFIRHEEFNIGIVSGREILGYPQEKLECQETPVLIMSDRESRHALIVDRFIREGRIVVRPLDERLGKIPCINAAAVLEDGTPILIVDVDDIVRAIDNHIKNNSIHNLDTTAGNTEKTASKKKILVIDDSITVRELEKQILENHGYQVETAVNGVDGWNSARTAHFDMIITDIDMPRMNGFELVEKLKANSNLKSIPVMIVSYKDREEDKLKGIEVGADYYLTKSSFHDNTMIEAVYKLIGEAAT